MTHKVLKQLEEDIQAIGKKNLEESIKSGKPLLDPSASRHLMSFFEKVMGAAHDFSEEQLREMEQLVAQAQANGKGK